MRTGIGNSYFDDQGESFMSQLLINRLQYKNQRFICFGVYLSPREDPESKMMTNQTLSRLIWHLNTLRDAQSHEAVIVAGDFNQHLLRTRRLLLNFGLREAIEVGTVTRRVSNRQLDSIFITPNAIVDYAKAHIIEGFDHHAVTVVVSKDLDNDISIPATLNERIRYLKKDI
jgi:hypothetical protein